MPDMPWNNSTTIIYQALEDHPLTPAVMNMIDNIHTYSDTQLQNLPLSGKKRKAPTTSLGYDANTLTKSLSRHGYMSNRHTNTPRRSPKAQRICVAHFEQTTQNEAYTSDTPIT